MDPILKQSIKDELTAFLNRAPSEDEIINAQTDPNIMGNIRDKRVEIVKKDIKALKPKRI